MLRGECPSAMIDHARVVPDQGMAIGASTHRLRRSTLCSCDGGFSVLEVLITSLIVGIAAVGTALMFAEGLAWVDASADDRVAIYLAQQKLEQLRSRGFEDLKAEPADPKRGCIPPALLGSTRPGEPCYHEIPSEGQPPYTYRTIVGSTSLSYQVVTQFPRYKRTTQVVCVEPTDFLQDIACPATPEAKRITVTVTPTALKARPIEVQTVLTRH